MAKNFVVRELLLNGQKEVVDIVIEEEIVENLDLGVPLEMTNAMYVENGVIGLVIVEVLAHPEEEGVVPEVETEKGADLDLDQEIEGEDLIREADLATTIARSRKEVEVEVQIKIKKRKHQKAIRSRSRSKSKDKENGKEKRERSKTPEKESSPKPEEN